MRGKVSRDFAHAVGPCGMDRVGNGARTRASHKDGARRRHPPYPFRHAAHTFSGVAGMSILAAPGTAFAIAFIMAASAPVVPASPTPLTPSGLVVAGVDCSAAISGGTSAARGMA